MNDDGIGVVAFVDNTASASSIDNDNNHWLTFLLKVIVNVPLLTKEVITSIKGPLGSYQRGYQSASLRQNITQPGVTCYAMVGNQYVEYIVVGGILWSLVGTPNEAQGRQSSRS
ncbi:hypothetical protein J6590_041627, partial [Homalodisca vitripennis]